MAGVIEVGADQAHHITTVLRLGAGATVAVFDGRGREWVGRIESVARSRVVIALGESRDPAAEAPVALTLAVGLLKGDQMSQVVRDATALGVVRLVPFLSRHTAVARPSGWADLVQRWQRIAVAATAQSGRAVVPDVAPIQTFDEILGTVTGGLVMCVEPAHGSPLVDLGPRPVVATLLVGPEGGWAADEVEQGIASGARPLSLGPRTLRAELAPAVALSSLWSRWGWA